MLTKLKIENISKKKTLLTVIVFTATFLISYALFSDWDHFKEGIAAGLGLG